MFKKPLLLALLVFLMMACNGNIATNSNVNGNTNASASGGNTAPTVAAANSANTANTNVAKPVDNSPKRISFGKGQNWGSSTITLPASGAQKFIVSAKAGQMMDVEVSSKETSVNLIKGKAQTTEDFGYLNAELQSNGDYIFEVRNSTKKEIKTSVRVTIEGGKETAKDSKKNAEESEIDESDSTVMDDKDTLPPPTETPKKKGN